MKLVVFGDKPSRIHAQHRNGRGGAFRPGFFYGMHVYEGSILGSTPDGRKAGLPISNSLSSSNGSERKGATATLKSEARFEHRPIRSGSLNLKLNTVPFRSEAGRAWIAALLGPSSSWAACTSRSTRSREEES